jgi:hypothetical protein
MPTINVAPIYSDAWAKTDYTGMAIIVEEDKRSIETTLLGVTCRLYWVRFFYTEINLSRWVEVSSIVVWTDLQRRTIPVSSLDISANTVNYATEFARKIDSTPGASYLYSLDLPSFALEDILYGFGCLYSIPTDAHASSYVKIELFDQSNTTPDTAAVSKGAAQSWTQSATYLSLTHSLATPLSMTTAQSLAFSLRVYQKLNGVANLYIYCKSFYADTARLI